MPLCAACVLIQLREGQMKGLCPSRVVHHLPASSIATMNSIRHRSRSVSHRQLVPMRILCHGKPTLKLAVKYGWLPGARYTNLRDIRDFEVVGMIDIEWNKYDFKRHLESVRAVRPIMTVAKDIEDIRNLPKLLDQAGELQQWCERVIIVPKDPKFNHEAIRRIPTNFIIGYSVPTKYGSTSLDVNLFRGRQVHLLGGRPDVQHQLRRYLNVTSFDGNRFTLDAQYGDYFDGYRFRKHSDGGYYRCIEASLNSINRMWSANVR